MKRLFPLAVLAVLSIAALASAGACEPTDEGPVCDDLAAVSVTVTVDDDAGQPVDDAVVTFTVDGGLTQRCQSNGDGSYQCGIELSGDFVISVVRTGFAPQTAAVTVEADECHVIGETVAVTLARAPPGG